MTARPRLPTTSLSATADQGAAVTLADCLEAAVQTRPGAPALTDQHGQISYENLGSKVFRLAGALRDGGVQPGDVVAIALAAGCDAIIALLGVSAAGAAFFFIDPHDRSARVERLVGALSVRTVIADQPLDLDGCQCIRPRARGTPFRIPRLSLQALAYVIATSGSGGSPKGVRISNRGLLPMLRAQVAMFRIDGDSRVLLGTPLQFDASISDIGTALVAGAQLFIPPVRDQPGPLRAFIDRHRITHADLPPAMMRLLGTPPASLSCTIVGGEVVPAALLQRWAKRQRVVVCYGPTEATVCSSMVEVDPGICHEAEIGRPLAHLRYRLVDSSDQTVETDGQGELWISGPGLALGYVGAAAEHERRFVMVDGTRWYRTGDLVRRAGQRWVFVGKLDRRQKVAGRLIYPEEIEAVLATIDEIADAAVMVQDVPRRGFPPRRTLIAYVVVRGPERAACRSIRSKLAAQLPAGMVPQLRPLPVLPTTLTGKTDRQQLLRLNWPVLAAVDADGDRSPADPARLLGYLTARVLGLDAMLPEESFVALGGDSLAAMELLAAAERYGLQLTAASVMNPTTPVRLAQAAAATSISAEVVRARVAQSPTVTAQLTQPQVQTENALFSGVTGWFGSHLLSAWLRRSNGCAWCIVRARDDEHAAQRVRDALAGHGLSWPADGRIVALAGDCAKAGLGLSQSIRARLSQQVGTVVHAAAELSSTMTFEQLSCSNIDGTANLLRLSRMAAARPFHLISSLAVFLCGNGAPPGIDEQTDADCMMEFFGNYAATKWGAESLLAGDGDARIHRLGLLVSSSRGNSQPRHDGLGAFIRGLARVAALPAGDHARLSFDVTPVAQAADASAALIVNGAAAGKYHLSSQRGATLAQLTAAMRAAGVAIAVTSRAAFDEAVGSTLSADSARAALALSARLGGAPRSALDLFLMTGRSVGTSRAVAASGVTIAEPDAAVLGSVVRRSLSESLP